VIATAVTVAIGGGINCEDCRDFVRTDARRTLHITRLHLYMIVGHGCLRTLDVWMGASKAMTSNADEGMSKWRLCRGRYAACARRSTALMRITVVMLAVSNFRQASPRNVFTAAASSRLLT
jgi:hypothetical protein